MRSIIQLAGRVQRHRRKESELPNIRIFNMNFRSLKTKGGVAYHRPGFENKAFSLHTHTFEKLITRDQIDVIDSAPRVQKSAALHFESNLVDLEHARLNRAFDDNETLVKWWTHRNASLGAILQRMQPFRKQTREEVDLFLMPDGFNSYQLWQLHERSGSWVEVNEQVRISRIADTKAVKPWAQVNYTEELTILADALEMPFDDCARKFALITLPKSDKSVEAEWRSHEWLGFAKFKPQKLF